MSNRVYCGRLTTCHGLQGEMKILLTDEHKGRFQSGDRVYLCRGNDEPRTCIVESFRQKDQNGWIKLKGIDSRSQAEELLPADLERDADDLPELEEGFYYVRDLIGMEVQDAAGKKLGTLKDVLDYPVHDIYVVDQDQHPDREVMIPAIKEFILSVDLEKKIIRVNPIEGMFDED